MRGTTILLAALTFTGCAGDSETASCIETKYRGGRLIDCESKAVFVPDTMSAPEQNDAQPDGSTRPKPSMIGAILKELVGSNEYKSCRSIEIPEGRWTICDGGFSLLERNEEAQRSASVTLERKR
ncbi:MAG: hypothetical protein WCE62_11510 [Polyangiales bacterium]